MANCLKCKAPIAWKKQWSATRRESVWVPHDPATGERGEVLYDEHKNGGGRMVRRARPSDSPHRCAGSPAVPLPPFVPLEWISDPPAPLPKPKPKPKPEPEEPKIPPSAAQAWARAEALLVSTSLKTRRVCLYGPPGTGKTSMAYRLSKREGWTMHRITLTEESSGSVLIGQYVIKGGDTVWMDGAATLAMRESHNGPTLLVLDEIDHASGDAMTRLLEVLNDPEMVEVSLPTGEVIKPRAENWRVLCTTNADPAASVLPAVYDRLHLSVLITHPHPELVESCKSPAVRKLLCATSRDVSIRCLLSFDALMADGLTPDKAARLVWPESAASGILDAMKLGGYDR